MSGVGNAIIGLKSLIKPKKNTLKELFRDIDNLHLEAYVEGDELVVRLKQRKNESQESRDTLEDSKE